MTPCWTISEWSLGAGVSGTEQAHAEQPRVWAPSHGLPSFCAHLSDIVPESFDALVQAVGHFHQPALLVALHEGCFIHLRPRSTRPPSYKPPRVCPSPLGRCHRPCRSLPFITQRQTLWAAFQQSFPLLPPSATEPRLCLG